MRLDPVLAALSMAAKAGRVLAGSFMALQSVKKGKARLVVLACDASDNTKKKFRDACAYRNIDIFEYASAEQLGRCIGREDRVVVALEDEGFAGIVKGKLLSASDKDTE